MIHISLSLGSRAMQKSCSSSDPCAETKVIVQVPGMVADIAAGIVTVPFADPSLAQQWLLQVKDLNKSGVWRFRFCNIKYAFCPPFDDEIQKHLSRSEWSQHVQ